MIRIILQKEPINIAESIGDAGTNADGAVTLFIGQARDNSNNKEVLHLEYQIYESMAKKELENIASEAVSTWQINTCIIVHRYGKIKIGEASILIAVSSPHRDNAFKSARYIIDTIKKKVPIWKKEFYADGSKWISEGS